MGTEWQKLPVSLSELCISTVLRCGQSFRWRNSAPDEWTCALRGRILSLRQDSTHLYYRDIPARADTTDLIRDYFNLSKDLVSLYKLWSSRDPNFSKKAPRFTGVRMLRQDPWENVVSFICSSNNNISRISQMVTNLCINFGPKLGSFGDGTYYDFPEPDVLVVPGVEAKLRELGFGYRAKYIAAAASLVANERPPGWLGSLREVPYTEAHAALLELPGVGPKVADCVCLMSLDKAEAVPVDTHVWQIAQRDYGFGKAKNKTLTKQTYDAIGNHFRKLWGKEAGWAHSVLFTADLRTFSERLKTKTEVSIEAEAKQEMVKADGGWAVKTVRTKKRVALDVVEKMSAIDVAEGSLADRVKRRRRK